MNKQSDLLDEEWVKLLQEAKDLGFTCDEVKDYLQTHIDHTKLE
ncbi:anti-repressor SinI family protein [Alkalihalobacillus sp. MEB130]|nr:anti-repressor SinI family protein [Alkalihalobacillus sp. MEB130]MDT8861922.1 anti-repressor SinI family protein [Alkalihalobacillus sp. MEB130]